MLWLPAVLTQLGDTAWVKLGLGSRSASMAPCVREDTMRYIHSAIFGGFKRPHSGVSSAHI